MMDKKRRFSYKVMIDQSEEPMGFSVGDTEEGEVRIFMNRIYDRLKNIRLFSVETLVALFCLVDAHEWAHALAPLADIISFRERHWSAGVMPEDTPDEEEMTYWFTKKYLEQLWEEWDEQDRRLHIDL